jgi:hypothetical protein
MKNLILALVHKSCHENWHKEYSIQILKIIKRKLQKIGKNVSNNSFNSS